MLRASRAEALLGVRDVSAARQLAERLYREARQHPLPNYLMSRVEYQAGNHQQALAYARALLSLQPGSPIGNTLAAGVLDVKFSFSAVQQANGAAHDKSRHSVVLQDQLVEFFADVTCVSVDTENGRAWIGGVVLRNNSEHPAQSARHASSCSGSHVVGSTTSRRAGATGGGERPELRFIRAACASSCYALREKYHGAGQGYDIAFRDMIQEI